MRYAQINSKYVCGIDLHAREMYACVMNDFHIVRESGSRPSHCQSG